MAADEVLNGINEGPDCGVTATLDLTLSEQANRRSTRLSHEAWVGVK